MTKLHLSEKTREAFWKWLEKEYATHFVRAIYQVENSFDNVIIRPLLVDFFDSVGIYIEVCVYRYPHHWRNCITYLKEKYPILSEITFTSRTEALIAGCNAADEIFCKL